MGGEIAQVIANADIPVVLKDVEQRFVDQGLEKARSLWQARVDAGKLECKRSSSASSALISGATDYDGFGDVDFVIEAVPERIEIKQSGVLRARRGDAGPRDPRFEHLLAVDHRDGRRRRAGRTRWSAFTSSIRPRSCG